MRGTPPAPIPAPSPRRPQTTYSHQIKGAGCAAAGRPCGRHLRRRAPPGGCPDRPPVADCPPVEVGTARHAALRWEWTKRWPGKGGATARGRCPRDAVGQEITVLGEMPAQDLRVRRRGAVPRDATAPDGAHGRPVEAPALDRGPLAGHAVPVLLERLGVDHHHPDVVAGDEVGHERGAEPLVADRPHDLDRGETPQVSSCPSCCHAT